MSHYLLLGPGPRIDSLVNAIATPEASGSPVSRLEGGKLANALNLTDNGMIFSADQSPLHMPGAHYDVPQTAQFDPLTGKVSNDNNMVFVGANSTGEDRVGGGAITVTDTGIQGFDGTQMVERRPDQELFRYVPETQTLYVQANLQNMKILSTFNLGSQSWRNDWNRSQGFWKCSFQESRRYLLWPGDGGGIRNKINYRFYGSNFSKIICRRK